MSMEINAYNNYATQTSSTNTTKNVGSAKDSNVTTSTVKLKTSTGGTRTEQIKTGYSNVNDYSQYLQGKYSYMNTGATSMQSVPTTVSVSSAFLKKCMNDLEKAKYLEENLAALLDCAKSAVAGCQGTLTNLSYQIDGNGNISVAISGTSDPDGKIAKENAERKAKEQKEKEEKLEKKRAEKKAQDYIVSSFQINGVPHYHFTRCRDVAKYDYVTMHGNEKVLGRMFIIDLLDAQGKKVMGLRVEGTTRMSELEEALERYCPNIQMKERKRSYKNFGRAELYFRTVTPDNEVKVGDKVILIEIGKTLWVYKAE